MLADTPPAPPGALVVGVAAGGALVLVEPPSVVMLNGMGGGPFFHSFIHSFIHSFTPITTPHSFTSLVTLSDFFLSLTTTTHCDKAATCSPPTPDTSLDSSKANSK